MDRYAYLNRRVRRIGPKIDLGCGKKCQPGFVGIDLREVGQDILWDVREGLPLPDDSVQQLYSSHFIEHLTDDEMRNLLVEILRVCAPGAVISVKCPHSGSTEAFYHGHVSYWSERRWRGIVAGFAGGPMYGKCFKLTGLRTAGIEVLASLVVIRK